MASKFIWTEEKEQKLKEIWNTIAVYKIAQEFGCADQTILKKAEELDLPLYKSNRWTKEEELLREYSKKYVAETIAKKLDKSYLAVQKK